MISFNDNNNNKYFTVIRDGVKFSQYVGVIQAGNLTIEILPKADKESVIDHAMKPAWRGILLDMLKECRQLKINHVERARLNLRSNSILEIYIELFLNEIDRLLQVGLVKKYKISEGNKSALKGRLDFGKNLAFNIIHQERFYVHFSEYSPDNIYNRLLYKTLNLISEINLSPWLTDKVTRLLLDFPELPDCKVSPATFEKLVLDRKTEQYKDALLISKMLLLNYRPDISGGTDNVIAILFDMNNLWQEFIFRRLKNEEAILKIKVHRQQFTNFWKAQLANKSKTVRPDIVIEYNDQQIIIDTKWKVIKGFVPSDDDLQQMFIYNLFWKCEVGFLLYPGNNAEFGFGDYHDHKDKDKFYNKCAVVKFDLVENNKLKKTIGAEIITKILNLLPVVQND